MDNAFGTIYGGFLAECAHVKSVVGWGRFSKGFGYWKPPQNKEAALEALLEQHDAEELLHSGVVTNTGSLQGKENSAGVPGA